MKPKLRLLLKNWLPRSRARSFLSRSRGGASGKLHGKVTAKEVAEQLYKLTGTEIDKKKIEMPASIKEFGSYDAKVRLHVGVVAAFKVKVEEAPL